VQAHLTGTLPDACTSLGATSVEHTGDTYTITVATVRVDSAACAEMVTTFEQTVALDTAGLAAGVYHVAAGNRSADFELQVDNVLVDPADLHGITGLIWHDLCAVAEQGEPNPSEGCVPAEGGGFTANGTRAEGEPGIPGVEVYLRGSDCSGANLASTFSDAAGTFGFSGLADGVYCVLVDPLANPNSGILIPGSWTSPPGAGLASVAVTLAGADAAGIAFGWDYQFLPAPGGGTPTPEPTETAGEGEPNEPGCVNRAKFVSETIKDNTVVAAGQAFTKVWTLENTGTCRWEKDYKLVFVSGEQMGGAASTTLPEKVPFGGTLDISINLTAPAAAGTYRGDWMLEDAAGNRFGLGAEGDKTFWVQIKVEGTVVNLGLGDPDWTDDMDSGGNWFLLDTPQARYSIENGRLRMRAKTVGAGDIWSFATHPDIGDFYIEAAFVTGATCVGLDRYGLIVRAPDTDSGYVFNVACNGQVRAYLWDGTFTELLGWTTYPAVNTGANATNRLGIWAEGDTLKLIINDVQVAEFENDAFEAGQFGLLVGSTNTANLDVFVERVSYWLLED
jgi:hypothetical protein